ncbi:MAG: DUF72 domain-containing protein [Ignavibacteriaceae bacterium]|nr:DUF72 domain-containing protein [Ignavibacteriaceae bacterium]
MKISRVRFGTCSWKYDSWIGLVYSGKSKSDYLGEYSQKFNTVEIDQWFWSLHGLNKISLPAPKDVKLYSEAVPDDFKFTIKVPNSVTLTHFYSKQKNEPLVVNPHFLSTELFNEFLKSIEPMKEKIGVLMFQFEYLNKQKMSSQKEFQERIFSFIKKLPADYKYGIEIRNPNYLNKSFFSFIKECGLTNVFLEGYYMPPVKKVFDEFKDYIENTCVIRLHGPDRKGIEEASGNKWNRIIIDRTKEIQIIAEIVKELASKKVDTFINVNNHFEGSAPLTIDKLKNFVNQ